MTRYGCDIAINQLSWDEMVCSKESLLNIEWMNIECLTRNDWFGTGPVPIWVPFFGGILYSGDGTSDTMGKLNHFMGLFLVSWEYFTNNRMCADLLNSEQPKNLMVSNSRWLARVMDGRCWMGTFTRKTPWEMGWSQSTILISMA